MLFKAANISDFSMLFKEFTSYYSLDIIGCLVLKKVLSVCRLSVFDQFIKLQIIVNGGQTQSLHPELCMKDAQKITIDFFLRHYEHI